MRTVTEQDVVLVKISETIPSSFPDRGPVEIRDLFMWVLVKDLPYYIGGTVYAVSKNPGRGFKSNQAHLVGLDTPLSHTLSPYVSGRNIVRGTYWRRYGE